MFTFKTNKPTGRYKSFYKPTYEIKLKKKIVGAITSEVPHQIRLRIIKKDIMEDKNPNCSWKWITLKKEFNSVDEAKAFLKENYERIVNQLNLYQGD